MATTSYIAFKKQADRSFFPVSTMPAPYVDSSSSVPTEGGAPATPEMLRRQDAWSQGFAEGLKGALAGDAARGLSRGSLNAGADMTDDLVTLPTRASFIAPMLGGKLITSLTGNDKAERGVRAMRELADKYGNLHVHTLTKLMRAIANSKKLDPKHLTQDAYEEAVKAGKGGVYAADFALANKVPAKLLWSLFGMEMADQATRGASSLQQALKEEVARNKRDALPAASLALYSTLHKEPAGPFVAWTPNVRTADGKPTNIIDIAAESAIKKSPEYQVASNQAWLEDVADYNAYNEALAKLKQLGASGAGGIIGLLGAHQITKRIPALKRKKIFRYLLNLVAAGGLGYAGWKLVGRNNIQ